MYKMLGWVLKMTSNWWSSVKKKSPKRYIKKAGLTYYSSG